MKRKKLLMDTEISEILYSDEKLKIIKLEKSIIFEIGSETTSDIAEAVCLMMTKLDNNHRIWKSIISSNIEDVSPERSLYWLTGGKLEWNTLENYNKSWSECYLDFQEEFGITIINILNKSKTLNDIREGFIKYLNLPILYDFAISKSILKQLKEPINLIGSFFYIQCMEQYLAVCKNPWCKAQFYYTEMDMIEVEGQILEPKNCKKCKSFETELSGGIEWVDKQYEGPRYDGPHEIKYKVTNYKR